jgi:hypothetical protein
MNIVLQDKEGEDFYIATLKKVGDVFHAFGKRIHFDGRVIAIGQAFICPDQKSAEKKVKDLVKTKIKRRDWKPIDLENLPKSVIRFLEVPPDMQVTPEEMVMIIRRAKAERYVWFSNTFGLEEFFDLGVEYLGFVSDEDENIITVHDRFGVLRDCFRIRMSRVEPTERAIEAKFQKNEKAA